MKKYPDITHLIKRRSGRDRQPSKRTLSPSFSSNRLGSSTATSNFPQPSSSRSSDPAIQKREEDEDMSDLDEERVPDHILRGFVGSKIHRIMVRERKKERIRRHRQGIYSDDEGAGEDEQVDENGLAENAIGGEHSGTAVNEDDFVEETQDSDDQENDLVAKMSRIDPNVTTASDQSSPDFRSPLAAPPKLALPKNVKIAPSNVLRTSEKSTSSSSRSVEALEPYDEPIPQPEAPPIVTIDDDDDEIEVIKTVIAQPRQPPPPPRAPVLPTIVRRVYPPAVPSTSNSSYASLPQAIANASPLVGYAPQAPNASPFVRLPSRNAVRAPVPPNNIAYAERRGGVPVDTRCEVYFSKCTTQHPRLHILSLDKMSECIYTAESQHFNNYFRFYCIYHSSPRCYVEIVPSENNGVLYQFGTHLNNCYREPRPRCSDTVNFHNADMMMFVKAQKCLLSPCMSILTVPSGSVAYKFRLVKQEGDKSTFAATCGCSAKAITSVDAVWVNYTHDPHCKTWKDAQADADGTYIAPAMQYNEVPGPSRIQTVPQRSIPNARFRATNIDLPPNPRMANWLSTHAQQHLQIRIDDQKAYMYWNRVQWSDKVKVKDAKVWTLGPLYAEDVLTFLLTGGVNGVAFLMRYYRNAFLKNYRMLGRYKGTDYGIIRADSPHILDIYKSNTLLQIMIQFIAVFSQFRFVMFTSDTDYDAFGDMNDTTSPIAIVKKRQGTLKFEAVIGNFTCS